jgi:hypothetical protein
MLPLLDHSLTCSTAYKLSQTSWKSKTALIQWQRTEILRNHGKNSYRGGFLTRLMLTKMHIHADMVDMQAEVTDSTAYFTAFNEKACEFSFAHFGATFYVAMIIGERPPARRNVQAEAPQPPDAKSTPSRETIFRFC